MLAACQNPTPQISFEGTSTVAGVGYDLRLVVDRHGDRLTGVYEVAVAGGSFSGTVDGTELTAELKSSEARSEEHTSELQSRENLVCRLLLEKKKKYEKYK